jgi:hypothetical protein
MANKPRKQDWQSRFAKFLEERQNMPFKWGQQDCIIFAARAAQAMTGYNFVAENKREGRGYKTRAQAEAMLDEHFKGKIQNVFTFFLGKPRKDIGFAQRGDIVLIKNRGEFAGGVIDNTGRSIVCAGPRGLMRLKKAEALMYWKLGE